MYDEYLKEKNINNKKKERNGAALIVQPDTNVNTLLKELIDKRKTRKRN